MLPLVASITVWPGLQRAGALGVLDHAEREPVLDRAHRVEGLELDVQVDVRRRELVDPDDRRAADRLEDGFEALAHDGNLPREAEDRFFLARALPAATIFS